MVMMLDVEGGGGGDGCSSSGGGGDADCMVMMLDVEGGGGDGCSSSSPLPFSIVFLLCYPCPLAGVVLIFWSVLVFCPGLHPLLVPLPSSALHLLSSCLGSCLLKCVL